MTVKSKLCITGCVKSDISFPALYVARELGHVVLFSAVSAGTVVFQGSSYHPVGYYSNSWTNVDRDAVWKRCAGRIELENDDG